MAVLKAGVRQMYRIPETPPLADHQGRDRYPIDLAVDAALEQLNRSRADTAYHPGGPARMGADDAARCDPRPRVRRVDRLHDPHASAMPHSGSATTHTPAPRTDTATT